MRAYRVSTHVPVYTISRPRATTARAAVHNPNTPRKCHPLSKGSGRRDQGLCEVDPRPPWTPNGGSYRIGAGASDHCANHICMPTLTPTVTSESSRVATQPPHPAKRNTLIRSRVGRGMRVGMGVGMKGESAIESISQSIVQSICTLRHTFGVGRHSHTSRKTFLRLV